MAKYCADCKHLNEKEKKEGKSGGCLYECKVLKKKDKKNCMINSTMPACDKFEKDINRGWYKSQCLYDDGKKFDNFSVSWGWVVLAIFLIILGIIIEIFNL